jgi:hypothetical protein
MEVLPTDESPKKINLNKIGFLVIMPDKIGRLV